MQTVCQPIVKTRACTSRRGCLVQFVHTDIATGRALVLAQEEYVVPQGGNKFVVSSKLRARAIREVFGPPTATPSTPVVDSNKNPMTAQSK